jgi:hypothetical protein
MRLIEDEHRARPELPEQLAKPADVGLVGDNAMGDEEARADAPRVGGEPARAACLQEVLAVDDGEVEAELLGQLVLPLQQHRGGRRNDDYLDAAPEQHLPHDEAGLDRLAKANVVGDQQVDAR